MTQRINALIQRNQQPSLVSLQRHASPGPKIQELAMGNDPVLAFCQRSN
jgi:hypothetical protein